jgi:hypothetical protein
VVLFGQASPQRFRPVSSQSQVAVMTGRAGASEDSATDIRLISPGQVLAAWDEIGN